MGKFAGASTVEEQASLGLLDGKLVNILVKFGLLGGVALLRRILILSKLIMHHEGRSTVLHSQVVRT